MAPVHARVVWVREGRAYVAALDTIAGASLPIGASLEFVARGKTVASGEVSGAIDGEVVVAMLTSGSLAGQKKLDRIQILVEPPPLRALRSLRVGFPSRRRANLLFSCEAMRLRPPLAPGVYRVDTLGESSYRWVSHSAEAGSTTLPDTIYAHQFDDAADEEIALERGEVDVAVFWSGELSRHIREHAGGMSWVLAQRSQGVVAVVDPASRGSSLAELGIDPDKWDRLSRLGLLDSAIDTVGLSRLNGDLFRSDLGPPPWGWGHTSGVQTTPLPPGSPRFDVDRACPGRQALERCLNRNSSDRVGRDSSRIVRLFYANAPTNQPKPTAIMLADYAAANALTPMQRVRADSIATMIRMFDLNPAFREGEGPKGDHWAYVVQVGLGAVPVFTIRCPIACNAALRDRLPELSRELVDLMDCDSKGSSP